MTTPSKVNAFIEGTFDYFYICESFCDAFLSREW